MKPFTTDQQKWQALLERDPQADGVFVYGVVTTGIYCRPICSSKRPNRDNVRFFETWQEAERTGFRPCKRCRPKALSSPSPQAQAIVEACRTIESSEKEPTLADLAQAAGYSPSYFHRLFKKQVGITPKQYAIQVRSNRVRASLQASATVTEAVYDAGFASSSRFYERAAATLGMNPSVFRNGGHSTRIRFAVSECDLGWVLVAATEKGICAIDFGDTPESLEEHLHTRFPKAKFIQDDPNFDGWVAQVLAFLEAPRQELSLPLDIRGTAFQQRVWAALQAVPAGSTATYGDIAARIGSPKAARAVAQACAANQVAVAVPCHRIVRGDGGLGGYRWGSERKRTLLDREARDSAGL